MAKRQDSITEGRSYNYDLHNRVMPEIAETLGLDVLPMTRDNYDYDFYRFAVIVAMENGLHGADRYDTAADVMRILLSPTTKGPAPIYGYVNTYRKMKAEGKTPEPFDAYWRWGVHQKTNTVRKSLIRYKKKRGPSIYHGLGEEDEGAVNEAFLPESREPNPHDVMWSREEDAKKAKAMAAVPAKLAGERNGAAYVALWDLMQEQDERGKKYTAKYMANMLNSMQVRAPGETGEWTGGAVDRSQTIIHKLANEVMKAYGVDLESISAARKGFRFEFSFRR